MAKAKHVNITPQSPFAEAVSAASSFVKDAAEKATKPDAELIAGLAEIMNELKRHQKRSFAQHYEEMCRRIEALAEVIKDLRATTAQALLMKADVVEHLNGPGIALYAARILAASLGKDLLARPFTDWPPSAPVAEARP